MAVADTLQQVNPTQLLSSLRSLLPCPDTKRAASLIRDGLYTGIGFAVLGFQKAQVLRREINQQFTKRDR